MLKDNGEVRNFSFFFFSLLSVITFLQKLFPYILIELLDIAGCDFMIRPCAKMNLVKIFPITSDLLSFDKCNEK